MTEDFIPRFVKVAQDAGLQDEQIKKFLKENFEKTAVEQKTALYIELTKSAGVDYNEDTEAYLDGFLKTALESGCTDEQAIKLAQVQLDEMKPENMEKVSAYWEGFKQAAAGMGVPPEAMAGLMSQSAGPGLGDMGKQAPPGAVAGPSGGGEEEQIAQVMQYLEQNPQEMQKFMQALQQMQQGQGQPPVA
jgi:hypothetical protein